MCKQEYLTKQHARCLKGVLAIIVLIHHIFQHIHSENFILNTLMMNLGPVGVSGFLFLSGYGLMESRKRDGRYIELFLKRKLIPFYSIYCIICIIYIAQKWILSIENISLDKIAKSFLFGYTYVSNGWYFQAIIVLYMLFYIVHHSTLFRNKELWMGGYCASIA